MSKNEARRQKQLAKKKAKRDDKRSQLARQNSDNPVLRLADAENWPIVAAWVPDGMFSSGLGQVILARRCPDGHLACGVFLVDMYCLGVKNAFWRIISDWQYDKFLRESNSRATLRAVASEYLAKLVYDAAAYAESIGFPPHPDYRHARMVLAGIDPAKCSETFTFGKDGKPFYINGPHETPERIRVIMHRVTTAGGRFLLRTDNLHDDLALLVRDRSHSEDERPPQAIEHQSPETSETPA